MHRLRIIYHSISQNRRLCLILFILYGLTITAGSLFPHVTGAQIFVLEDKILHLLGYGAFTWIGWLNVSSRKAFIIMAVTLFIYSGLIEIAQSYTGRSLSLLDLLANGIGIIVAVFLLARQPFPIKS